jgi:hypothetical protein
VIAADGKVFAASFRPTGPWFECDFPDGTPAKVRVDAEDIVVAMDFRTGHTLWVAAELGGILTWGRPPHVSEQRSDVWGDVTSEVLDRAQSAEVRATSVVWEEPYQRPAGRCRIQVLSK